METTNNKADSAAPRTKALTITEQIQAPEFLAKLANALPRHLTKERYARFVLTAISKNPRLRDCTQESVMASIVTAAQLGIEIDGRHGHLVPFKDGDRYVAQFVPDYKGLIQLVYRTGNVASVHLDVICRKDSYEYNKGHLVSHKPNLDDEDRGPVIAVYSLVRFVNGGESVALMTRGEVEAIRNRKKSDKKSPWDTDWNEMAKKTVFKRHAKVLEISPEFRDAEDLASREDDEPVDVTPKTAAEKAGFVRPETVAAPALPASDPFPGGKDDVGNVYGASNVAEAEVVHEPAPARQPRARQQPQPQPQVQVQAQAQAAKHPVEAFVTRAGFTLQEASDAMQDENMIPGPVTDWSHIPSDVAAKLVNSQVGFLAIMGRRRAEGGAA